MAEIAHIMRILMANKDKDFVQRILNPRDYPTLDLGEGNFASHKMSWADMDDGSAIVYPNVVHNPEEGSLTELDKDAAIKHALDTGEFIQFETSKDADWFSKRYKEVWSIPYKRPD
jgi:hypothetical protein